MVVHPVPGEIMRFDVRQMLQDGLAGIIGFGPAGRRVGSSKRFSISGGSRSASIRGRRFFAEYAWQIFAGGTTHRVSRLYVTRFGLTLSGPSRRILSFS